MEPVKPAIGAGIAAIMERWPNACSSSAEEPIFVLAAGCSSGESLLQRMLMPQAFIWGEPYGPSALIALAEPLRSLTEAWPEPDQLRQERPVASVGAQAIANLYPQPAALLDAHLSFFDRLFIQSARATGAARWGISGVRLTADHAMYLKWLFPRAKVLFLHRNPWDAYRSYLARADAEAHGFAKRPEAPLTLTAFAQHWRRLATSFRDEHRRVDGLLVSYDEVIGGDLARIEGYLSCSLSQHSLEGAPLDDDAPPRELLAEEQLAAFSREVEGVAKTLGYEPPRRLLPGGPPQRESLPTEKCAVLVPALGPIEHQCDESLKKLEERGYRVIRMRGYSQIDLGRSQLASDVIAQGFEETLWIDSDVVFDPDDVERLRSHGEAIVSAIYPKKGRRALASHVLAGTKEITFGEQGGLVEIQYAATGFLLVKRQVYLDMQDMLGLPPCNQRFGQPIVPYFLPLLKPDGAGLWYLSEDYSFCERARQCGYKIWADTRIRLGHIGKYTYYWEDAGGTLPHYDTFHFHLKGAE